MANEKMTKKDFYTAMIAYFKGEETAITKGDTRFEPNEASFIEFCEGEKTLLEKKASNRKPNEAEQKKKLEQKENVFDIIKALGGVKVSSADILKHSTCMADITSTSKVTSLVGLLKTEGRVVSTTEKNRVYYSIV